MKFRIFSVLICCALLLVSQGCRHNFVDTDNGTITGIVIDQFGNQVSGATVTTSPATNTVLTDNTGAFKFTHMSDMSYTVSASKAGVGSGTATVVSKSNQTVSCTIVLTSGDPNTNENRALVFNGVDGGNGAQVFVPHSTDLNLCGSSFTLEAWCNPATILAHSRWGQWIMNKGIDNSQNEYLLGIDQYGTMTFWSSYTGTIWSRSRLTTNQWTHVALVVNEQTKTATMYINGEEDGSVSFGGNVPVTTSAPLYIGARNYFGQSIGVETWDGTLEEVRIWTAARTKDQIRANKGLSLSGTEPGLLAYWKFNEASGSTTTDVTGNGHTGTLMNSVRRVLSTAPVQ